MGVRYDGGVSPKEGCDVADHMEEEEEEKRRPGSQALANVQYPAQKGVHRFSFKKPSVGRKY